MEKLTLGGLRRAVHEGDMSHGSVMMGQVAGMCKDIRPLQEILDSLIHESEEEAVTLQQAVKELCYE